MIEILSHSPLLTLFIVVALGAIIGSIPFGRIKFGAAGALFVGLALSAIAMNTAVSVTGTRDRSAAQAEVSGKEELGAVHLNLKP